MIIVQNFQLVKNLPNAKLAYFSISRYKRKFKMAAMVIPYKYVIVLEKWY